jgi:LacI family transcriptional regulator
VLANFAPQTGTCCSVLVDNERVGYLAARHLIEAGRVRLAFVAAREEYQPVRDRRRGIRAAIEEAGPGVSWEELDSGGLRTAHGRQVGESLAGRARGDLPDGIIAVTDQLANGLIEELHTVAGIRVPAEVAVVGCENDRGAGTGPMPLTVVDAPGRAMGREAVRLLLDEVAAGERHRHITVVLAPELIVRASTAGALGRRAIEG